ncbi:MAG TPA: hypothetical protein PLC89_21190 [Haliscomenobacter sp.]|uniref:hypothetical protein n=1 Tax=Haliscomenobacter sp. TaxID=2717303 RepID=UPI002C671D1F|nr:hypothetical protein [Haliscomenobacter sp.]HOY19841.1 hypothetical protein [Haliscomenobacter sp.]
MFGKVFFPADNGAQRAPFALQILSTACLILLISQGVNAQFSITASEVETWTTTTPVSSDYNLNSAYVYLLNPTALQAVFEGDGLNKGEKKDVGLKKGDYPQYMYLAVNIKDPLNEANTLTIPLMIHDVRNPAISQRLVEYGGRFLENIPDDNLKNDIVAKVKFEAFKGNNSNEFWKKTAEISLNLGRTATSILKNPITGTFSALSDQIIPQVDKGIKSMGNLEDPQKIVSEFYIKLLNKELSGLYEEKVISAILYRIHWDVEKPVRSKFFNNARPGRVDDLKRMINTTTAPFILVVNTKAEYNTDHSQMAYNQQYIDRKAKDFRKIQNAEKREVEKSFLEILKLAVELNKQMDVFQNSLNTKYPDWLAYSKVVELYFHVHEMRQEELAKLSKQDLITREKYTRLYGNIHNDVDLWFGTELLQKARGVSAYLLNNMGPYNYGNRSPRQIYEDIEMLEYYRDRVKQIEIQGKLPREIQALETYDMTLRKLKEMETALFEADFTPDPRLDLESKKAWLLARASQVYPLCQICGQRVGEKITAIENATYEQNIKQYKEISAGYYSKLECFENITNNLTSFVKANKDSATVSPMIFASVKQDREDFIKMVNTYSEIAGKDHTTLSSKDLADLIRRFQINREKMLVIIQRLRGLALANGGMSCLMEEAKP